MKNLRGVGVKTTDTYTIEDRKQRWINFMDMDSQEKCVYLIYTPDDDIPPRPEPWPDKVSKRIEWAWRKYNVMLERSQWLRDDSIPFLDIFTGTEIFAEAFGCRVHRPEDNMPFALPLVHNALEASKIKVPNLSSTPLSLLFDIADELKRRAGTDALVRLPDIQSPMDIAALIWDKNDFYIALIEEPEAVRELADKVKQLLFEFLDEWFSRYGKEFMAHHPDYYMPYGITLSEDEIGVVNEKIFLTQFLPELIEMSNRYGQIGIHCCANSVHHWSNFKEIPNLRLLNLNQPEDVIRRAYRFFARHTAQMHNWQGTGPVWTYPAKYPDGAHVVIQAVAQTKEEAIETADR
jgi:hypothetical protein